MNGTNNSKAPVFLFIGLGLYAAVTIVDRYVWKMPEWLSIPLLLGVIVLETVGLVKLVRSRQQ